MVKKLFIAGAMVGLGAFLWFNTMAGTLAQVGLDDLMKTLESQVPVEKKIAAARKILGRIEGQISKQNREVAKEEIHVANLTRSLADQKAGMEKNLGKVAQLRSGVDEHLASTSPASAQKLERLNLAWATFKQSKETVAVTEQALAIRTQNLESARTKAENLRASFTALRTEIDSLEAARRMQEARQVATTTSADDGTVGQLRNLVGKIRDQLREDERVRELDADVQTTAPAETAPTAVLNEIDRELGATPTKGSKSL